MLTIEEINYIILMYNRARDKRLIILELAIEYDVHPQIIREITNGL